MMLKFSISFQVDDQNDTNITSLLSDRNFDGKVSWGLNFRIEFRPDVSKYFCIDRFRQ